MKRKGKVILGFCLALVAAGAGITGAFLVFNEKNSIYGLIRKCRTSSVLHPANHILKHGFFLCQAIYREMQKRPHKRRALLGKNYEIGIDWLR